MDSFSKAMYSIAGSLHYVFLAYAGLVLIVAIQRIFFIKDKHLYGYKNGVVQEMFKCHSCGIIQSTHPPLSLCGGDWVRLEGFKHPVYWCYFCNKRSVTMGVYAKWTGWKSISLLEFFNGKWEEYTQNRELIINHASGVEIIHSYFDKVGSEVRRNELIQHFGATHSIERLESSDDTPRPQHRNDTAN